MRILIVEDNALHLKVLAELLQPFDAYPIATTESLIGMRKATQQVKFDVVVLDVFLPDSDADRSLQAVAELRRQNEDLAIIVTSGQLHDNLDKRAVQFGADEFLPKTGDIATLYAVLLASLERHKKDDDAHIKLLRQYVAAKQKAKNLL